MQPCKSKLLLFGALILASCAGRLPQSVREDVASENQRLQEAERQIQRLQGRVHEDVAKAPDLFQNVSAPAEWDAAFADAHAKLRNAERAGSELTQLARRNRKDSLGQVNRLLGEVRELRSAAIRQAAAAEAAADKWLDVSHNPTYYLDKINREREEIRGMDLEPVTKTVHQAEQDWPAKKTDLDGRLAALLTIPKNVETEWSATQPARHDALGGKLTGPEVAALIRQDDELSEDVKDLPHKADELHNACGQLYGAWDKILVDLDVSHENGREDYREEIRTVRTHFLDVAAKKTETSSDEQWVDVSEPAIHAVENDLGMAIAHKDAGLFDSEAQTTPQPAGFAYIAPPSQGSNEYGYWTHDGGQPFWTFLPQYLLLRELMWGHDYRPIIIGEYDGYRTAQREGRSYYGQETPTAPPKYGSHGTFTQTRYAQSRYVQSGGFKDSKYASQGGSHSSSPLASVHPDEGKGALERGSTAGRRFGAAPGSQGKRFGGFRAPGRRFGRR
ncbi:MAG: hypothetical protein JOY54_07180 [Acidobacteriaceae bacterium]|nr:hypothetical protein [Acidobacteriaceae bacterium]